MDDLISGDMDKKEEPFFTDCRFGDLQCRSEVFRSSWKTPKGIIIFIKK